MTTTARVYRDDDVYSYAQAARRAADIALHYARTCVEAKIAADEAHDFAQAAESLIDSPFDTPERSAKVRELYRETMREARSAQRWARRAQKLAAWREEAGAC